MKSWDILSLDVWGNKEDGFEINGMFKTGDTVELTDDTTSAQIVQKLKYAGYLNKRLRVSSFSIDQHERDIYLEYLGVPIYNLRLQQD